MVCWRAGPATRLLGTYHCTRRRMSPESCATCRPSRARKYATRTGQARGRRGEGRGSCHGPRHHQLHGAGPCSTRSKLTTGAGSAGTSEAEGPPPPAAAAAAPPAAPLREAGRASSPPLTKSRSTAGSFEISPPSKGIRWESESPWRDIFRLQSTNRVFAAVHPLVQDFTGRACQQRAGRGESRWFCRVRIGHWP